MLPVLISNEEISSHSCSKQFLFIGSIYLTILEKILKKWNKNYDIDRRLNDERILQILNEKKVKKYICTSNLCHVEEIS